MKNEQLITLGVMACASTVAVADVSDKSQYNVFNPVPKELRRELSPDRPDVTESAITVDAGHYVAEVSVFDFRRDNGDDSYTFLATNLKVGLTNNTDIQFVFDAYTNEESEDGQGNDGFSDVQVRLKYNLFGNDGGDSSLAFFPFVKIPTGSELSNNEWEGGLIVPFSTQLSERVGLGLMAEFDAVFNDETDDHEFEFLHTAVLGFDLTETLGNYVEYIGITSDEGYQAALAVGLTYSVNEDLLLDGGVQFGLNDAAEDLGVFTGFTKRF